MTSTPTRSLSTSGRSTPSGSTGTRSRNADYAEFVDDTGYVTVAERALDPAAYPGADPADLVPGAMVFTPTAGPVDLRDWRQWWRWQPGASWRQPFGPGSGIDERMRHPVIHVAFQDAARTRPGRASDCRPRPSTNTPPAAGSEGADFAWGDEAYPGRRRAGELVARPIPLRQPGRRRCPAPVGSYPANGYGLLRHDRATSGSGRAISTRLATCDSRIRPVDAGKRANLLATASAQEGFPDIPRRVLKGGSHLCSPDYCLRFRPAARSPQAEDTGMSHIGFRCARDA